MKLAALILSGIVAFEHLYFLYLEMFQWTKPRTMKAFGTDADFAAKSKVLAANQGLYNGFLAAGLIWALVVNEGPMFKPLALFFLGCVVIAGIYGAFSTKKIRLFYIQAVPAILALVAVLLVPAASCPVK